MKNKTYNRKKIMVVFVCAMLVLLGLIGRLVYLMIFDAEYYQEKAEALHEREREIKAARGEIIDRNGTVLATNKTVCTISVIHSQIKDKEKVIRVLSEELELEPEIVRKRVEKVSSMERVKTNVDKEIGDRIREYELDGVKVDEDFKRYYPYDELASKVLGFTGGDNQGIIGLEVKYEEYLKGINGMILTTTDARGIELEGIAEDRKEAIPGNTLQISLDYNIQKYAQQAAEKVMEEKAADRVSVLVNESDKMGEILSMVNVPEFNLNDPFSCENHDEAWRNGCVSDTYEPGSVFKIITAGIALEEDVVSLDDRFYCPGYITVEDRRIHCHKRTGHGSETFVQGIQNSCNPVFIDLGLRIGSERYYADFMRFGLLDKTGIDLPGEAATIMHQPDKIGQVELATISFGQSFQLTPIELMTTVSSLINGGNRITPHIGKEIHGTEGTVKEVLSFEQTSGICSEETSDTLRKLLEGVVAEGSGKNAKVEGYAIGGKTATSQTLPRSDNVYIASFLGFYPVDDPALMVLVKINNPKGGAYYGGTIAAPVAAEIFREIIPYAQEIGVCN